MKYFPKKIENKWRKKWLEDKVYEPDFKSAKKPFYNLMMFPYPSAEGLHMGSVRTFTGVDIYGRLKRMQGYDVFEPIGLDGFGIHSENYALKTGKHPFAHAKDSEKNFYRQLSVIGNGFAWRERLETYDPEYYKWTQWIFIQMFNSGLAYRKKAAVNWCPSCMTVLADEQVIQKSQIPNPKSQINSKFKIKNSKHEIHLGVCERCETKVITKDLEQWFFKTTEYAERLLKNLETINWPEPIKIAQRNWIGKSEGAIIKFPISPSERLLGASKFSIDVFTTRPDTLFGAMYMVVAPEHPLIEGYKLQITNYKEIEEYIKKVKAKTNEERIAEGMEKTGVELKGIKAVNPATKEEIPIWVADYVLGDVGTGAIMAVPAHDSRDFEFMKKHRLPIRTVVAEQMVDEGNPPVVGKKTADRRMVLAVVRDPETDKYLVLKWKERPWKTFITGGLEEGEDDVSAAVREIAEETGYSKVRFVRPLGHVIAASFFAAHKNENRLSFGRSLLFELEDKTRLTVAEEETKKYDVIWLSYDEIVSAEMRHAEMARIIEWLKKSSEEAYTGAGILINSGKFSGLHSEEAKWEITKFVGGEKATTYRLRDWLISRQRYWGPPIPMIFCQNCKKTLENSKFPANGEARPRRQIPNSKFSKGELDNPGWIAVPEKDLPVKLPHIEDYRPAGTGRGPLAAVESFYKIRCPKCKSWARRETDVSDTFLDSAWYYLGYLMAAYNWKLPLNGVERASPKLGWKIGNSAFAKLTRRWLPVNMYIGGAEHAVLHLLYVRFVAMVLYDRRIVHFEEPFATFKTHGLITKDGAKMSKSRGNVVNPDEYINAFGSDAVRMYLAFLAPLTQGGDFRDEGIKGITRFLERVWKFSESSKLKIPAEGAARHRQQNPKSRPQNQNLERIIHRTIKKITEDVEILQYNTAISALMIMLNEFEKNPEAVGRKEWEVFLKLLAPFAPHLAEELWFQLRAVSYKSQTAGYNSIHLESWPKYDTKLIKEETFDLVIQVNGKVRGRVTLPIGTTKEEAKKAALDEASVKQHVSGDPRRVIFVPNKLINFVM